MCTVYQCSIRNARLRLNFTNVSFVNTCIWIYKLLYAIIQILPIYLAIYIYDNTKKETYSFDICMDSI